MELTSLNYIDYIALAILFISAMLSTIRGMTREFLGLVGWFVAIFIAKLSSPVVFPILESFISVSYLITPLSWIIPFFAAFIVWYVFAGVVSPKLSRAGLGALDGGMGVFFGLARGAVILVLFYVALLYLYGGASKIPDIVNDSNSSRFSVFIINVTKPLLPNAVLIQFENLSIPKMKTPATKALDSDSAPDTRTSNQKNTSNNQEISREAKTKSKSASSNVESRVVE